MRTYLQKAAVVLLVLTSLYPTIRQWHSTIGLNLGAEALSAFEARLEGVKEATMFALLIFGTISGGSTITRTSIYGGLTPKVQR